MKKFIPWILAAAAAWIVWKLYGKKTGTAAATTTADGNTLDYDLPGGLGKLKINPSIAGLIRPDVYRTSTGRSVPVTAAGRTDTTPSILAAAAALTTGLGSFIRQVSQPQTANTNASADVWNSPDWVLTEDGFMTVDQSNFQDNMNAAMAPAGNWTPTYSVNDPLPVYDEIPVMANLPLDDWAFEW